VAWLLPLSRRAPHGEAPPPTPLTTTTATTTTTKMIKSNAPKLTSPMPQSMIQSPI
jgi:hypothetical protein